MGARKPAGLVRPETPLRIDPYPGMGNLDMGSGVQIPGSASAGSRHTLGPGNVGHRNYPSDRYRNRLSGGEKSRKELMG